MDNVSERVDQAAQTVRPEWKLHNNTVENQRPIRVIVIGAGYSGIYLGIRIPERIRNCQLVIYEKNGGVGGTWHENRYPGAACDVPSHSYQFSFNPKHDWSSLYAPAPEIRAYLESSAKDFGADRFVKLGHEVTDCRWDQDAGKWRVAVVCPDGTSFVDSCDVLISARGLLNDKQWPAIGGLDTFKGALMHSASWDESYDFEEKRIGVIGSGSSAIQIIPNVQRVKGSRLSCFIRSRTWISPPLAQKWQDELGLKSTMFTQDQIKSFESQPEAWLEFRTKLEADANNAHAITLKGSEMHEKARMEFEQNMKHRLRKNPQYFEWMKPSFAPGCRRLTPGPGFLEALVEDNVEFVRDNIDRVEPGGIVTSEGRLHELDVLICATGFYASSAPPFPTTGLNGISLQEHWEDRATSYLSLATDGFPNHFFMLGPNSAIGSGSLTMMIESTGDYIVKVIRKMQKENIKAMSVKKERVRDFLQYADNYFRGTVFMDDCRSWYKKDGRGNSGSQITGLWPGSTLHCIEALRSPRWEDFDYEFLQEQNGSELNVMGWLGNGWASAQLEEPARPEALAFYLLPGFHDMPTKGKPEENEKLQTRQWSH